LSEIGLNINGEQIYGNIIYVPDDYSTIQEAIDHANPGDTIIVRDGIYIENIKINKSKITIKSENGFISTTIQSANPENYILNVTRDYVRIEGFTVEGAAPHLYSPAGVFLSRVTHCEILSNKICDNHDGIHLYYSSDNILTNNTVNDNYFGLHLVDSPDNVLSNNTVKNNEEAGFRLEYSSNNILIGNIVDNSYYGFYLCFSSNETLFNFNIIKNNAYGICSYTSSNTITNNLISNNYEGVYLRASSNNVLRNNTVNNNGEGIYLSSSNNILANNTVSNSRYYGIILRGFSSNNIIIGNIVNNSLFGFSLKYSRNNTLVSNTINNNRFGISIDRSSNSILAKNAINNNTYAGIILYETSGNLISDNKINNNNNYGIRLTYSPNNNLTRNTISNNVCGLYLGLQSLNNIIYLNNFINTENVVYEDHYFNNWNSTFKISYRYKLRRYTNYLGNYWSNYTGMDNNRDGIGDTPFVINDDNIDYYPLMKPYRAYSKTKLNPIFVKYRLIKTCYTHHLLILVMQITKTMQKYYQPLTWISVIHPSKNSLHLRNHYSFGVKLLTDIRMYH